MSDRRSTAGPGPGFGGSLHEMALAISDLQGQVERLQRNAESPTAGFLWLPGGQPDGPGVAGELWVKRIVTGSAARVAGPL